MKKLLSLIIAFAFTLAIHTSTQAQVTVEEDITGGIGLSFGTNIGVFGGSEPGIDINGYYTINDEIRAGGKLTYYLVSEDGVSAYELNIDGHYMVKNEDDLIVYGLAGLSYAQISYSSAWGSSSGGSTGLNVGGGAEYDLGDFRLYAEPKFTLGGFGQIQISAGARMRF